MSIASTSQEMALTTNWKEGSNAFWFMPNIQVVWEELRLYIQRKLQKKHNFTKLLNPGVHFDKSLYSILKKEKICGCKFLFLTFTYDCPKCRLNWFLNSAKSLKTLSSSCLSSHAVSHGTEGTKLWQEARHSWLMSWHGLRFAGIKLTGAASTTFSTRGMVNTITRRVGNIAGKSVVGKWGSYWFGGWFTCSWSTLGAWSVCVLKASLTIRT